MVIFKPYSHVVQDSSCIFMIPYLYTSSRPPSSIAVTRRDGRGAYGSDGRRRSRGWMCSEGVDYLRRNGLRHYCPRCQVGGSSPEAQFASVCGFSPPPFFRWLIRERYISFLFHARVPTDRLFTYSDRHHRSGTLETVRYAVFLSREFIEANRGFFGDYIWN